MWLKAFLVLEVTKFDFFVVLIFSIYVKFLDLIFLNKFTIFTSTLLSTSTTLLSLALNAFRAKPDNLISFNSKLNSVAILLKYLTQR